MKYEVWVKGRSEPVVVWADSHAIQQGPDGNSQLVFADGAKSQKSLFKWDDVDGVVVHDNFSDRIFSAAYRYLAEVVGANLAREQARLKMTSREVIAELLETACADKRARESEC